MKPEQLLPGQRWIPPGSSIPRTIVEVNNYLGEVVMHMPNGATLATTKKPEDIVKNWTFVDDSGFPARIWAFRFRDERGEHSSWTTSPPEFKAVCYERTPPVQPIETAPKDGTWILVWEKDYDCWMPAQWGLLNYNPNKYDGIRGWSGHGYIFTDVTHWMPMPGLPKCEENCVE